MLKIVEWIEKLGVLFLTAPYRADLPLIKEKLQQLFGDLTVYFGVDASSLFLLDNSAQLLRFFSGFGYEASYEDYSYYLGSKVPDRLVSYVFLNNDTLNHRRDELKPAKIPCSYLCETHIKTRKFENILAIPIRFQEETFGVIKLENKKLENKSTGPKKGKPFPKDDEEILKILASVIGVILQQTRYTEIWTKSLNLSKKSTHKNEYISGIVNVLAKELRSECVSIFLFQKNEKNENKLKYAGGIGYKKTYEQHEYSISPGDGAEKLTEYIFKKCVTIRETKEGIINAGYPFSGKEKPLNLPDCKNYILSGEFRNILGLPLVSDTGCLGVLKLENKLPVAQGSGFNECDQRFCSLFVKEQIVPTLEGYNLKPLKDKGVELLINQFGEKEKALSVHNNKVENLFKAVIAFQKSSGRKIKNDDCVTYLDISHNKFYELKKTLSKVKKATEST